MFIILSAIQWAIRLCSKLITNWLNLIKIYNVYLYCHIWTGNASALDLFTLRPLAGFLLYVLVLLKKRESQELRAQRETSHQSAVHRREKPFKCDRWDYTSVLAQSEIIEGNYKIYRCKVFSGKTYTSAKYIWRTGVTMHVLILYGLFI